MRLEVWSQESIVDPTGYPTRDWTDEEWNGSVLDP